MTDTVANLIELATGAFRLTFAARVFHWNIVGPEFFQLHQAFGKDYEALDGAVDRLAERARALGGFFPRMIADLEVPDIGQPGSARDMVKVLLDGHQEAARIIGDVYDSADSVTQNILDELRDYHEKQAWMYQSFTSPLAPENASEVEAEAPQSPIAEG